MTTVWLVQDKNQNVRCACVSEIDARNMARGLNERSPALRFDTRPVRLFAEGETGEL